MPGLLPRHFFYPRQTSEVLPGLGMANPGSFRCSALLKYVKNKHLALLMSIFDKPTGF